MYRVISFIIIFSFVSIMLYFHSQSSHVHEAIAIPEGQKIPKIEGEVFQEESGEWVITLKMENFQFAKEKVGIDDVDFHSGHAHLYINGMKFDTITEPVYRLGQLNNGEYDIKVALIAHNHNILLYNGKEIAFNKKIIVSQ